MLGPTACQSLIQIEVGNCPLVGECSTPKGFVVALGRDRRGGGTRIEPWRNLDSNLDMGWFVRQERGLAMREILVVSVLLLLMVTVAGEGLILAAAGQRPI